jgi:perosamine synthetase
MKKANALIPLFKVFMSPDVVKPVGTTLLSGYIGQGPKVEEFEQKLKTFLNTPYLLTLNSATSALHLALRLAAVGPGDEVISTPMTCTATNWPILAQGARIVWADIDPATGNIDPASIQKNITRKTKAIMVVDWAGYPCDIARIKRIAGSIPVIEDAAHAFGAMYKRRMVGTAADFTCFSFQAIKHLTTGDGGLLVVSDKKTYERGKLLRWYGIDREKRSQHERIEVDVNEWGYKFHMNDIAATIGLANMKHIPSILKKHRANAKWYRTHLANLSHVQLLGEHKDYNSSYWLFTIRVKHVHAFINFMADRGIMVSQVHRRNDTHPTVKQFKKSLPGVDTFTSEMVCVPVGWWVTASERNHIVKTIKAYDAIVPTLPTSSYGASSDCVYCA